MNRPSSPKIRNLALRLLVYETRPGMTSRVAAGRVSKKLSRPLCTLVGVDGYRSLLSRALVLGSTEVAWLKTISVNADGNIEGFDRVKAQFSEAEVAKGEAIFIAHLLGLLVTFIGEALTLGVVRDAWPKAAFDKVPV